MHQLHAARTSTRARAIATLSAVAATAITAALATAPAAHATDAPTPPQLSGRITQAITDDGLDVQVINGWEAVAGPAASIDSVQALATSYSVGTIADYTGPDETGQAILIFTGNQQVGMGLRITGATIASADNDTSQMWYVFHDNDTFDAAIPPGTAMNIPLADLLDFNTSLGTGQDVLAGQAFYLAG